MTWPPSSFWAASHDDLTPSKHPMLRWLLLCCALRAALGGEVEISSGSPSLAPTSALAVFSALAPGDPAAAFSLADVSLPTPVVAVDVVGACAGLSVPWQSLAAKTAVVLNAGACDGHGAGAILRLLTAGHTNALSAIIGYDSAHGDESEPNWSLLPAANLPSFLRSRTGRVYSAPSAWASRLRAAAAGASAAGLALTVKPTVRPMRLGEATGDAVAAHHMQFYSYVAPAGSSEPLILTVTPTVGDPDLYVNTGAREAASNRRALRRASGPITHI